MNMSLKRLTEVYVFAFAFLFGSRPLSDGDFWWHLKTGEYIVHNRLIPRQDIYSFTKFGHPWVAHEWLADVFFYVVYSRLGFNILIFIFGVATAIAFWLVFKRAQSHPFIAAIATLLGVWTVLPTIGVRPRVLTLLLASFYLTVLLSYSERRSGRRIWILVPLLVLWANLHAGYVIGVVFIALTIVGIVLDDWAAGVAPRNWWLSIKQLTLVFLACVISVVINPYGFRIYTFPFEFFLSPVQQNEIVDWLSPNFHQSEMMPLAALILLTIFAVAISPKRARLSELLFFIATLYATLKSNRHMAIFALVAAPLLARHLQYWFESNSFRKTFDTTSASLVRPRSPVFAFIVLLPLLIFVFRLNRTIYAPPKQEMVAVPLKAVEFMKANNVLGNTLTDPNIWGGYLIWAMPSNRVYIDGRIDMYGDDFVREFLDVIRGVSPWREAFNRYGVEIALVSPQSVLNLQLKASSEWQQLYEDEMAVVFVRRR